jgi:hypothetical protein
MSEARPWVYVTVGVLGTLGTIAVGIIAYQSGQAAVNKDYVGFAITALQNKDTSPELRRWSVDVLSKFSPVPFGSKLKQELEADGLYMTKMIFPRIRVPTEMSEPCPDILKDAETAVSGEAVIDLMEAYEVCRIKQAAVVEYVTKVDKLFQEMQKESDQQQPPIKAVGR